MKRIGVLLVVGLIVVGCGKKAGPEQPAPVTTGTGAESTLAARLDVALKIAGTEARDAALQSIAGEAAAARDVAIVKRALGAIMGSENKDSSAELCAVALALHDDARAAGEIAQMISSVEARDRALATIAMGKKDGKEK